MNWGSLLDGVTGVARDAAPAFILLLVFFAVFQSFFLKRSSRYVATILRGVALSYVGLILMLQGINVAFEPMGIELGKAFAGLADKWIFIPVGFVVGFLVTFAEPQIRVLSREVETASSGFIKAPIILYTLCLGVAAFVALGMARTLYGIPMPVIIIPGYGLAIILLFFADRNFVALAYDSGSIATGPITVAFIMSLTVGAASVLAGRDPLSDGLGLIGIITLAPIISIQLLSLMYKMKPRRGGGENE